MVVTASLSRAMADQSACPEYAWAAVRACSATAAAPSASATRPASRYVTCSSSIPTRILTVTGTS